MPCLGWRVPGMQQPLVLEKLSVRVATVMQLGDIGVARSQLHTAYAAEARETPPAAAPQRWIPPFDRLCWIRWENAHKETAWRVSIDSIGIAGNTHLTHAPGLAPCGCGVTPTDSPRLHTFWQCAEAQAVVQQLAAQLAAPPTREQVWLFEAPTGVQQAVWDVVAMAALAAMERRRTGALLPAVSGVLRGGFGTVLQP
eukprot:XP_001696766.1 predicted protein [Chlamydomonas reinhardtii]